MRCGSAFGITKLLRELTGRDVAIKAAGHETKTRGKHREREYLVHLNTSCQKNDSQILFKLCTI